MSIIAPQIFKASIQNQTIASSPRLHLIDPRLFIINTHIIQNVEFSLSLLYDIPINSISF